MGEMTKRELAFLLIGLGTGLLLSVAIVIMYFVWVSPMFIVGVRLRPSSILLLAPFFMIIAGLILLRRKVQQDLN